MDTDRVESPQSGRRRLEEPQPLSGQPPRELTRLLTLGDDSHRSAAWEAFLERYNPLVLSVARSLGGDRDAIMDRYAFVLEHLRKDDFARLRAYRPEARCKFSTWFVVVIRRLCLDQRRRRYGQLKQNASESQRELLQTRRRLVDLVSERIDLGTIPGQTFGDPDLALRSRELNTALAIAIAELPTSDRLLLRLRFGNDLTGKEIADILRLPSPFHVYRRIDKALGQLRASLVREGIVEPRP